MWNISPITFRPRQAGKKFYQHETDHKDRKTGILRTFYRLRGQDLIQEEQKDEKKRSENYFRS